MRILRSSKTYIHKRRGRPFSCLKILRILRRRVIVSEEEEEIDELEDEEMDEVEEELDHMDVDDGEDYMDYQHE